MFGSMRVVAPYAGKTELAKARMRTAAEIISRSGASDVWMASVLGGYGAGTLHLYGWFESMTQVMEVSGNVHSDPAWQALMAEREANPAADIAGPSVWRRLFGEGGDENDDAVMQRLYVMPRSNFGAAIALLPEVQELLKGHNVHVSAWAPVIADDMTRMDVVYSAPDPVTLGKSIDEVGTSDAFQAILTKASELGTLDRASGLVTMA